MTTFKEFIKIQFVILKYTTTMTTFKEIIKIRFAILKNTITITTNYYNFQRIKKIRFMI